MAITLDGTTGISSVDGSNASPSVRGSDSNSGILYSADAIKFSTGGTQRAYVDNNGLHSAGHILQVVTVNKTDTASSSAGGGGETAQFMSASITPSSSSNKVLVIVNANIGCNTGLGVAIRIWRDGATPSAGTLNGDSAGSRRYVGSADRVYDNTAMTNIHYSYLDSPSTTSSTTYGFVGLHQSASTKTITLNYSETESDSTAYHRAISSITLMEVAV